MTHYAVLLTELWYRDVVLGLGLWLSWPWLSLRTKLESLVMALALRLESLLTSLLLLTTVLLIALQLHVHSLVTSCIDQVASLRVVDVSKQFAHQIC